MDWLCIFITGAAILALQLIASRIMAPFFGVSLYIWTGILSITLLCLAFGYFWGGAYSRRKTREDLYSSFYFIPSLSGFALVISALLYPFTFGWLARASLIFGTFVASVILLAVPLVAMSALNPILVAIKRADAEARGDAGSGAVFFVSTIGSVFGVLIAAFGLIPYFRNQESILIISLSLGFLTLAGILAPDQLPQRARMSASVMAILCIIGSTTAALNQFANSRLTAAYLSNNLYWRVVANYPSPFGSLKVVDLQTEGDKPIRARALLNDGLLQDSIFDNGRSSEQFTYSLEAVTYGLVPEPKRVLVLGMGIGVIPSFFANLGANVDVVEINPQTPRVAKEMFHYNAGNNTSIYIEDARTFVKKCNAKYDIIIGDLFVGDGVPEHLLTREFFDDTRGCLKESGVFGMNSFMEPESAFQKHMLSALVHTFGRVALMPQGRGEPQFFLFATKQKEEIDKIRNLRPDPSWIPDHIFALMEKSVQSLQYVDPVSPLIAGVSPLTDENNHVAVWGAAFQMGFRANLLKTVPDFVLAD